MTPQELIARARSAIGLPTAYWLGQGGFDPDSALPGSVYTVGQMIQATAPNKRAQLQALAAQAGYPPSRWNDPLRACDCSGFTCWVVGVVRGGPGLAWINTDAMYRYVQARVKQHFHPPQPAPEVGALVVYPSGRLGEAFGHVGVITEVSAGRVQRAVHCSSTNFRFGGHHDSIEETDAAVFDRHAPVRYLRPKALDAVAPAGGDL